MRKKHVMNHKRIVAFMLLFMILISVSVSSKSELKTSNDSFLTNKQYYPAMDGYLKKYGYIDKTGTWVIPPQFDYAYDFHEGFARVECNEIVGLINVHGVWTYFPGKDNISAPIIVSDVHEGLIVAEDPQQPYVKRKGFINPFGDWVISPQFSNVASFQEGYAKVEITIDNICRWGFIDSNGNWAVPPIYEEANSFVEGLAGVAKNGKWGYINPDGKCVIPFIFTFGGNFKNGLASVGYSENGSPYGVPGIIDRQGNWIVWPQPQLDFLDSWINSRQLPYGLCASPSQTLFYGLIDFNGKWLLPPCYENPIQFCEGLSVQRGGTSLEGRLSGYINIQGEWQIPPKFAQTSDFRNGLAQVLQIIPIEPIHMENGSIMTQRTIKGYIDTQGNWVYQWEEN